VLLFLVGTEEELCEIASLYVVHTICGSSGQVENGFVSCRYTEGRLVSKTLTETATDKWKMLFILVEAIKLRQKGSQMRALALFLER
jgi:hypothetical protein